MSFTESYHKLIKTPVTNQQTDIEICKRFFLGFIFYSYFFRNNYVRTFTSLRFSDLVFRVTLGQRHLPIQIINRLAFVILHRHIFNNCRTKQTKSVSKRVRFRCRAHVQLIDLDCKYTEENFIRITRSWSKTWWFRI